MPDSEIAKLAFSFIKGGEDVVAPKDGEDFDWDKGALRVRENLHDALNAKNLACPRQPNFDPPCRLNFDPGLVAEIA